MIALDIGNSRIKAAHCTEGVLQPAVTLTEIPQLFKFIRGTNSPLVVSSVRPALSEELSSQIESTRPLIFIAEDSPFAFQIRYRTPQSLGSDRLCGIEGAVSSLQGQGKSAILTVDCGTATTLNYLDERNQFVGGMILPGLATMAKSLSNSAEKIPPVSFYGETGFIGVDTETCIRNGIVQATVSLIEKAYLKLSGECAGKLSVFVTGGAAPIIIKHLRVPFLLDTYLVLRGVVRLGAKLL